MARMFVMNDNLTARVEIESTDDGETFYAFCVGCGVDMVEGAHERFTVADTLQVAEIHVDGCTRCADPACRIDGRHDAGHRCRKTGVVA